MRYENWPEKLAAYFASMSDKEFEQGVVDCGHFVANAVVEMTGEDHYSSFRGAYTSVAGYIRILRDMGYEQPSELLDDTFYRHPSVSYAGRGDIVMRLEGDLEALGVCDGRMSMFLNPDGGLVSVPTASCEAAWRVD